MVALANDWRLTEMQALVRLSPAMIVIQYRRLMADAGSEMPVGVTMQKMFEAVVAADLAGSLEPILDDQMTSRVAE